MAFWPQVHPGPADLLVHACSCSPRCSLFGVLSYYFTSKTLSENLDLSLKNEVRWVRDFIAPAGEQGEAEQALHRQPSWASGGRSRCAALRKADATPRSKRPTRSGTRSSATPSRAPRRRISSSPTARGTIIYRSYNLADRLV